ncbi:hypothetical protein, partial [Salmonella sp. s51228]|uniref:hypothetical protein n=1 Tax=Salmonella sp. s51228 TaxID=3159652 RepID=UPI003980DF7C
FASGKDGLKWVCNWASNGSLLGYQGHGLPEFKSDIDFMHSVLNKNGHVLDLIDYKRVIPKGAIEKCVGNCIYFKDGTCFDAHLIINATGYMSDLSFLPEKFRFNNIRDKYKHTLEFTDTTLSFVGFVRPVVGSIPQIAEAQARLVSMVYSGRVNLPDSKVL